MRKTALTLMLSLMAFGAAAQTMPTRINKSLFTHTTVHMNAVNDTVRYYEFGKKGQTIVSGDYDTVMSLVGQMRQFSRDSRWGDKQHITENLTIERRHLTGPRAYRISNDSVGTRISTGFNGISESWHAIWLNRPTNADSIAAARAKARKAAEGENPDQMPFGGPFGDGFGPGGFGGGFGGPF